MEICFAIAGSKTLSQAAKSICLADRSYDCSGSANEAGRAKKAKARRHQRREAAAAVSTPTKKNAAKRKAA
jgi:hypothetical protein